MKKFFYLLLLSITIIIGSCTKDDSDTIVPFSSGDNTNQRTISVYGKWQLVSAYMYIENLETGEKKRYSHFSDTKTISSLRYSGSYFNFETIEKGITTWEFTMPSRIPGNGRFILNSDSTKKFAFEVTASNWTIIEDPTVIDPNEMQLGGSARPLKIFIDNYDLQTCKFYVQEEYENIGNYNCKYFNELIFKKIQ